MEKSNRPLAFLAYLVPLIGPLFVLLSSRKNIFAVYHASQSLALLLIALIAPVAWAVISWVVVWVPLAGGLLASALFALVIAAYLAIVVAWLFGLINSLRGQQEAVPVFGAWGDRVFELINKSF